MTRTLQSALTGAFLVAALSSLPASAKHAGAISISWKPVTASPLKASEANGVAVNGRLYRFGGYDAKRSPYRQVDSYDPVTNRWRSEPAFPASFVVTHSAIAVSGTDLYLCGGFLGRHPGPSTNQVWKFNTQYQRGESAWTPLPALPESRGAGGCAVIGPELHFFGGGIRSDQGTISDRADHWYLNLQSSRPRWRSLSPLPHGRNHIASSVLGSKIYAIGGQHNEDEDKGESNEVDIYDRATNTWSTGPSLPRPTGHISSSTFNYEGYIMVLGGDSYNRQTISDVLVLGPGMKAWQKIGAMPTPLKSVVGGTIDGKLYIATGTSQGVAEGIADTQEGLVSGLQAAPPAP